MIESYRNILDTKIHDIAESLLNVYSEDDKLTKDVIEEIIKMSFQWMLDHTWLKFPEEAPTDPEMLCSCKIRDEIFVGRYLIPARHWYIQSKDYSGFHSMGLLWQPFQTKATSSSESAREAILRDIGRKSSVYDVGDLSSKLTGSAYRSMMGKYFGEPKDLSGFSIGIDPGILTGDFTTPPATTLAEMKKAEMKEMIDKLGSIGMTDLHD